MPIDFDKESISRKLVKGDFRREEKTLFILEGVLMYLQSESVDQTFKTIRELALPYGEVVFDYIYMSVLRQENVHYGEKGTAGVMAKAGEQWHFGIEEGEISNFLEGYGLNLLDHRTASDLEEMYFKDQNNHIVGHINGTHCLTRAKIGTI